VYVYMHLRTVITNGQLFSKVSTKPIESKKITLWYMGVYAVKDFVGDTKACFVFGMTVVPTLPFLQIGPDLKKSII